MNLLVRLSRYSAWITLLLIPLWTRWLFQPPLLPSLYVTRFVIFTPLAITVALWVLSGVRGVREVARSRARALWALSLLTLAVWAFASTAWAFIGRLYPDIGMNTALQWSVVVLFAFAIASTRLPPRIVLSALVIGLAFNAAITVAQAAHQQWIGLIALREFEIYPGSGGVSILRAGSLEYVRPYGLMPHPNMLAGTLMIGTLAACGGLFVHSRLVRAGCALVIGVGVLALLLTFSRAAWGGFAVGLLILLPFAARRWMVDPSLRPVIGLTAALIGAGGVFFAAHYSPFILARTGQTVEAVEMRSVADRIVFIDFALQSIRERPLHGVGAGNFPWRTSYYLADTFYDLRGDNVHNIYLSVAAELGLIGLGLYVTALIAGLVAAVTALRGDAPADKPMRAALIACVLALLAVGWLDHYPYTIVHFQTALWGLLAAAAVPAGNHAAGEESKGRASARPVHSEG
ncbi:MAG: O-antigen ligase family protein [bacterium]|nr:O-antigen ligase family protein [bacterium]